jgi:hypothetical protein
MTLTERLWRLLPDLCEMPNCKRRGVRGNEQIIAGRVMCDDCHAEYLQFRFKPMSEDVRQAYDRFFGL